MEFKDLDIYDFGHKLTAAGLLYTDGERNYILYFPNESVGEFLVPLSPTVEEWQQLLKQTDGVWLQSPLTKAYVKKSVRRIEQNIVWRVYARDNYTCRYCNRTGIPLTVDHVDLWEAGGATTEANLITSCGQCNRNRGNLPYNEWLLSPKYKSHLLPDTVRRQNEDVLQTLPTLEKFRHPYKRKR